MPLFLDNRWLFVSHMFDWGFFHFVWCMNEECLQLDYMAECSLTYRQEKNIASKIKWILPLTIQPYFCDSFTETHYTFYNNKNSNNNHILIYIWLHKLYKTDRAFGSYSTWKPHPVPYAFSWKDDGRINHMHTQLASLLQK